MMAVLTWEARGKVWVLEYLRESRWNGALSYLKVGSDTIWGEWKRQGSCCGTSLGAQSQKGVLSSASHEVEPGRAGRGYKNYINRILVRRCIFLLFFPWCGTGICQSCGGCAGHGSIGKGSYGETVEKLPFLCKMCTLSRAVSRWLLLDVPIFTSIWGSYCDDVKPMEAEDG